MIMKTTNRIRRRLLHRSPVGVPALDQRMVAFRMASVVLLLLWLPLTTAFTSIPQPYHQTKSSIDGRSCVPSLIYNYGNRIANRRASLYMTEGEEGDVSRPPSQDVTTSSDTLPANLRRKIRAPRPLLGHVVPASARQQQKKRGGSIPSALRPQGGGDVALSPKPPGQLRIVAGRARGRALESPSVYLRPMMAKVKEAVFSTLTAMGVYDDASSKVRHLDLFCGSGSVGLESLSRGAAHATFVDLSPDCCRCVQRNLQRTGLNDDTLVCCGDALAALRHPTSVGIPADRTYDLITICPPYEEVVYADLLEAVVGSALVTEDTIVVIEYPVELLSTLPPVVHAGKNVAIGLRNRKYGRTVVALYMLNPSGRYPLADRRPDEFVLPPR